MIYKVSYKAAVLTKVCVSLKSFLFQKYKLKLFTFPFISRHCMAAVETIKTEDCRIMYYRTYKKLTTRMSHYATVNLEMFVVKNEVVSWNGGRE